MARLTDWIAKQANRDDAVGEYARARARGEAGTIAQLHVASEEFHALFPLKGEPMSDLMKGDEMIDFPEPPVKPRDGSMDQLMENMLGPRTIGDWLA